MSSGGKIELWTDGSCWNVDGGGGWAFAAVCDNVIISEGSGHVRNTTNNRMELQAIIEAMRWMVVNGHKCLVIHTDSRYSQGVIAYGHSSKSNPDLIALGQALYRQTNPIIRWVKGHVGNRWNEYVDDLAGAARIRPENFYLKASASLPPARSRIDFHRLKKGR